VKHPGKGIVFLLSVLLSLCADGRVESRDKSSSTPTILISFDGAQPQVIEKLLQSGKLPADGGFAKLISEGTQAQGMTAVLPTVTATNRITLATGAYPERTNIPANTFHLRTHH
jgi:predicted AlkP superfamily pyrophosphatase or phosphodiesterase